VKKTRQNKRIEQLGDSTKLFRDVFIGFAAAMKEPGKARLPETSGPRGSSLDIALDSRHIHALRRSCFINHAGALLTVPGV